MSSHRCASAGLVLSDGAAAFLQPLELHLVPAPAQHAQLLHLCAGEDLPRHHVVHSRGLGRPQSLTRPPRPLVSQKRGEWRIFTNPLFTREGTNEPARGKRKLGQDKPASTKRARRGSSSPASRAGTPADTNGDAPTPGGGSKAGGDSGGRLSRGSGNGTSAGGTTRAAPRARRRGRAGKSALDAVKAAASVGHNAAGLLPGAAGFLAMTGAVPLTVDAMRSALGGQRAKAAATGGAMRGGCCACGCWCTCEAADLTRTRLLLPWRAHSASPH